MLTGIRIFTADKVWRKILTDLDATVLDAPDIMALNFDDLKLETPISCIDLKAAILNAVDCSGVLKKVFGKNVLLPDLQLKIVIWLYRTGGMSIAELKTALGYAPDMTTHTVDTAIYQLRKVYGRDFIKNEAGVYKIGKL